MPPLILTVSGLIGSGKTTICRHIEQLTGWRFVSAGTILRKMAEDEGVSVIALNERAKTDASIDKEIDDSLIALNGSREPLIVDSRLAWHFIPGGYKIHLVVDRDVAARRVYSADRADESYSNAEAAYAANAQRQRIENERFQQYYGIDCDRWSNYDLILDSGTLTPLELAERALEAHAREARGPECQLDPRRLLVPSAAVDVEEFPPVVRPEDATITVLAGGSHVLAARESAAPLIACRLA
jgi:cytidylate kinase